ncbi:allophanate hydrolase subunit 1 [Lentibacter algarum]|uniref:5-oxoprolinase subunit B family protein n=1 Tax=Lentibacter algarum TaxID=576131 RepID=UPI001C07B31F|nr:carboxyltransferase domain-containing protein [Lentibacter algarum]MBU2980527.1 allophanate hydrolase subunit 1 [Lentibacter algarum]
MSHMPAILPLGTEGYLVRFADQLDDVANRAVLRFATEVEADEIAGVLEVSTALASVFVRFDRGVAARKDIVNSLQALLNSRDWFADTKIQPARLWRVPALYGGDAGPQLREAAELAGVSQEAAVRELSQSRVRVLALGFAPGQPYLGMLPEHWNIGRQAELTPSVPAGALVIAVRQLVLFANPSPTGWRQIALTKLPLFDVNAEHPFALTAGDELVFEAVSEHDFALLETENMGGAKLEEAAT